MKKIALLSLLLIGFFICPKKSHAGTLTYQMQIASSTNAQLISTTSGVLYDVWMASAAAQGEFVVCFDSASTNGLSLGYEGNNPPAQRIVDLVVVSTSIQTRFPAGSPPIPFNNGLVCINSVAKRTKVYYKEGLF